MLSISSNVMAGNSARHLNASYNSLSTSVERLSSGLRINSAKDDAAGLAVRELMRADIAVLDQGSRNAADGISMLQTMEGAMGVIDENLIRMKELAEQSATGSYSDDQRTIMNAEFEQMAAEIDRISENTSFNGISMLNSATGSVGIHVGSDETIDVDNVDMTTEGLGVKTGLAGFESVSAAGAAVTDTDTTAFLTVTDGGANADDFTIDIQFTDAVNGDEDAISVVLQDGAYTLEDVVNAINLESQNLGNDADGNSKDYAMASIVDDGSGNYSLKLNSRTGDADGVTITGTTVAAAVTTSGVFAVAGGATEDLTATEMEGAVSTSINILNADAAKEALTAVNDAIVVKDEARAAFGYKMNRLESVNSILGIQVENLKTAESRISDVDVATEMADMTKNQVLAQAGTSMLSQANSMPQMAMALLR